VPTNILISSDPWENRVAILEDGTLAELYVEREEKVIGSIFKGKVQNVLPGMGASFVDIGLGRNAFLYVDDINKTPLNIGDVEITQGRTGWAINEKVSRGDDVLVQIVKEPRGLKGARISTNISLPGRYLILMPTGKYSGVSRKIESADERNRLKQLLKVIRPEGMATVVRTAAAGVSQAELIADLGVLIRMWHGILENYKRSASPALLHKDMNLVFKAARDFITPEVENVFIDDPEEADRVKDFMRLLGPQYVDRIQAYTGGRKLFGDYKIDDEMAKLLRPKVNLPSGGSIVIETTEALTVIDINSGKFTGGKNLEDTIVKTNVEAAAEIARQVRLRDIGGIIVCDFIDMNSESARSKVIATLELGLKKDRTRTTIQSFSPLGLLEFTRKRVGKDLAGQLRGACPTCSGIGTVMSPESVTISTFRKIAFESNGKNEPVHIHAAPMVGAQVEFWYETELQKLAEQIGTTIDVRVDPAIHPEKPVLVRGAEKTGAPAVRVGDEFEVELLNTRMPNATSAVAVVNGRLVEVENSANIAGHTIKIKVIDVDGDDILAEARSGGVGVPAAASADGAAKSRRRRGGRGRKKELTAAEQAEELRELAEEAARGVEVRAAIGISTQAEADAEDANSLADEARAAISAAAAVTARAAAGDAPAPRERSGRRDRTDRPGRDRAERAAETPSAPVPFSPRPAESAAAAGSGLRTVFPGESLSGDKVAKLPGETLSGNLVSGKVVDFAAAAAERGYQTQRPAPAPRPQPAATASAPNGAPAAEGEEDAPGRKRRRRRRGRGGAGTDAALGANPTLNNGAALDDDADEGNDDGDQVESPADVVGDGDVRRKRRRRRRRGRGGVDVAAQNGAPVSPDRQIFRVGADGAAHPTGDVAPKEPSRAIARIDTRRGAVALDAPKRIITAPADELKVTTPARRRAAGVATRGPAAALESKTLAALPAPAGDAPKRRTTARNAPTAAADAPTTRAASVRKASVAAPKRAAAAKKTAAAPVAAKKTTARKATAAKASAARAPVAKAPVAKAPAKKTAGAASTSKRAASGTAKKKTARKKS